MQTLTPKQFTQWCSTNFHSKSRRFWNKQKPWNLRDRMDMVGVGFQSICLSGIYIFLTYFGLAELGFYATLFILLFESKSRCSSLFVIHQTPQPSKRQTETRPDIQRVTSPNQTTPQTMTAKHLQTPLQIAQAMSGKRIQSYDYTKVVSISLYTFLTSNLIPCWHSSNQIDSKVRVD